MRVEEHSKTLQKEEPSQTIDFEIGRTPAELRIFLKAPKVREFFAALADPNDPFTTTKKWPGKFFRIPDEKLPKVEDATFDKLGDSLLIGETASVVNLSFLRSVDLDKGVTFKMQGLITLPIIESFENGFIEAGKRFVEDYITEYHSRFQITTRRIIEEEESVRARSI